MKLRPLVALGLGSLTLLAACGDDDGASGGGGAVAASTGASSGAAPPVGSASTAGAGGDATSSSSAGGGGEGGGGDGGHGGHGGGGGAASGDLDEAYCTPLARLICERAVDCGCGEALPGDVLDEGACVDQYRGQCLDAYAFVTAGVEAGTAFVDAEAAADCITLFDDATPACERPRGTIPFALCPTWFWGLEALDEPCGLPYCAGGEGYCDGGTCVARLVQGEPCTDEYMCATGLLCFDGQCAPPLGPDEKCDADVACEPPLYCSFGLCATALRDEGEACDDLASCRQGLVCADGLCEAPAPEPCAASEDCGNLALCATPRACVVPGGVGAACGDDDGCGAGTHCDVELGACVAYPGLGEDCENGTFCAAGLACSADFGQCVELPGDGDACLFGPNGPFACEEGLGCIDGSCGPLPGEGDACAAENRCADGLGCAFTPDGSFCVVPGGVGTVCENDGPCEAALHCDFATGECVADFETGDPCTNGNECATGDVCSVGAGASFECLPAPGKGDACVFDCADGLACTNDVAHAVCVPSICLEL